MIILRAGLKKGQRKQLSTGARFERRTFFENAFLLRISTISIGFDTKKIC